MSLSVVSMVVIATAEGVAFITGSATVIAAVVLGGWAAKAASDRQEKQLADAGTRQERELADAGERQQRSLASEYDRQQAALDHDRRLVDIRHLRELLDGAAAAYEESYSTTVNFAVSLSRTPDEEGIPIRGADYSTMLQAFKRLGIEAHRIEMRFPPDHKIPSTYNEVYALINERFEHLRAVPDDEVIGTERDDEDTKIAGRIMAAFKAFTAAVRVEVGILERAA